MGEFFGSPAGRFIGLCVSLAIFAYGVALHIWSPARFAERTAKNGEYVVGARRVAGVVLSASWFVLLGVAQLMMSLSSGEHFGVAEAFGTAVFVATLSSIYAGGLMPRSLWPRGVKQLFPSAHRRVDVEQAIARLLDDEDHET